VVCTTKLLRFVPHNYCGNHRLLPTIHAPTILHPNTSQKYTVFRQCRPTFLSTTWHKIAQTTNVLLRPARIRRLSPAAITEPPRSNLKEPPPTAMTTATDEVAAASVATSRTTNTTASASTQMPPRTVHVPGPGGGGDHETANDELTKATAATTLAYGNRDSASASNAQMTFTIRNYVTQYFFPMVKFITKKEKLAFYPPGTNPTSYCAVITRGCNLPQGIDLAKWWETVAKRVVKK
jgi:hypothetical protein